MFAGRSLAVAVLLGASAGCTSVVNPEEAAGSRGASSGGTGGEGLSCSPRAVEECPYNGRPGTEGIGMCKGGARTCNAQGTAFGPCEGEVLPAFDHCNTAADEDCDGAVVSCSPWAKQFGDASAQLGYDVAVDAADDIVLTGYFEGQINLGLGPYSAASSFLVKFDPSGAALWGMDSGDSISDLHEVAVAIDAAGNIAVAGYHEGAIDFGCGPLSNASPGHHVFVLKRSPSGACQWSKSFGDDTGAQRALGVAFFAQKGGAGSAPLAVVGRFTGQLDFGPGAALVNANAGADAFAAKLDGDTGAPLWSKQFGDDAGDLQEAVSVAVGAADEVLIAGNYTGQVDFGAGPLPPVGSAQDDVFLVALASDGTHLASERFGDGNVQTARDVAVDEATGDAVVMGEFSGTIDFGGGALPQSGSADSDIFLVKMTAPSYTHVWSRVFVGAGSAHGASVAVDGSGRVLAVGDFTGTMDFGAGPLAAQDQDGFIVKLDTDGDHLASQKLGGAGFEKALALAVDSADFAVVTGSFDNQLVLDGLPPLSSAGGFDVFLAKLQP